MNRRSFICGIVGAAAAAVFGRNASAGIVVSAKDKWPFGDPKCGYDDYMGAVGELCAVYGAWLHGLRQPNKIPTAETNSVCFMKKLRSEPAVRDAKVISDDDIRLWRKVEELENKAIGFRLSNPYLRDYMPDLKWGHPRTGFAQVIPASEVGNVATHP